MRERKVRKWLSFELTFGTAAWKIKSVKVLGDLLVNVAWIVVV